MYFDYLHTNKKTRDKIVARRNDEESQRYRGKNKRYFIANKDSGVCAHTRPWSCVDKVQLSGTARTSNGRMVRAMDWCSRNIRQIEGAVDLCPCNLPSIFRSISLSMFFCLFLLFFSLFSPFFSFLCIVCFLFFLNLWFFLCVYVCLSFCGINNVHWIVWEFLGFSWLWIS